MTSVDEFLEGGVFVVFGEFVEDGANVVGEGSGFGKGGWTE